MPCFAPHHPTRRGNHDNLLMCGDVAASASKELTAKVYKHFFDAKPYSSRDVGEWKMIALNSMYGECGGAHA